MVRYLRMEPHVTAEIDRWHKELDKLYAEFDAVQEEFRDLIAQMASQLMAEDAQP